MKQYHDLLRKIVDEGVQKADRTGVGTRSLFGAQMRFDLTEGFPLLTTKKIATKALFVELLWFLRGDTNISYLHDHDVHIWDEWADENGNLGPVYGAQWRSWPIVKWSSDGCSAYEDSIDQITNVIEEIKTNPFSRRLIVSAWNPAEVDNMALPPCHTMFQFNVRPDLAGNPKWLDCQLYQRSGDFFLGVPFNIASYALLTQMIAAQTDLRPGDFIHTLGDAHLYNNHVDQAHELLSREPRNLPWVGLTTGVESIFDYTLDDIWVVDYNPHPAISAPIAV